MLAGTSKPWHKKLSRYIVNNPTGCWIWQGAKDKDGYGRIRGTVNNIPWFKFAHRASFEFHVSQIPKDAHVLHKCDVPSCINPCHLYLGDPAQNGLDKKLRGRARTKPQPGELNGMYGRTGKANPFYGKSHTWASRQKMRATREANKLKSEEAQ